MDETLVLNDASKEDVVIALLGRLDLPGVETRVEIALDYPGQQLAVDLCASTPDAIEAAVEAIQASLKAELGLEAPTSSDLERASLAQRTV